MPDDQRAISIVLLGAATALSTVAAAPASPAALHAAGPHAAAAAPRRPRDWSGTGSRALTAVAEADEAVKGGAADPAYALERTVARIVAARG
ncbi:hypothetical protein [Actinomadura sp. NPDC000600]|uniref:hypothetical protein n=1 Tax=Actinomadura sp. NPDC000600 TaxID=3154262 RepID=UPI003399DE6A